MHVHELMKEWGDWSSNRIGTEYPSMSAFANEIVGVKRYSSPVVVRQCSEDVLLTVDLAVGMLGEVDEDAQALVMLVYQRRKSISWIAKKKKVSRTTISKRLESAEAWLAGWMSWRYKITPSQIQLNT